MPRSPIGEPYTHGALKCNTCGRAFGRPDHLARHESTHNKYRPYRCGLCDRGFGRGDALLRHSSHVHRGQKANEYIQLDTERDKQSSPPQNTEEHGSSTSEGSEKENPVILSLVATSDAQATFEMTRITALDEPGLDTFLDALLGMPSYSGVTEALCRVPERIISQQSHWPSQSASSRLDSSGFDTSPKALQNDRVHLLPAFHRDLFPSPKFTDQVPHPRTALGISPSLEKASFDRLIGSYKSNCAFMRPFLHFQTLDFSLEALSTETTPETFTHGLSCNQWKRRPPRALVFSILALGALSDQKEAIALEFYNNTRKEILGWLAARQNNNSTEAPPLQLLQAFINYISFGANLGDRSIEGLTVGHSVSLRNLIQLANLEAPTTTPPVRLQSTCESCGQGAPTDWLNWMQAEERKRTCLTYFAVMSSTLTYLDAVSSMDWREVGHDMPCSDLLWTAENPSDWRLALESEEEHQSFRNEVEALFSSTACKSRPVEELLPHGTAVGSHGGRRGPTRSQYCNDYSSFILITALHREVWIRRFQNDVDVKATKKALQQWQTVWLRLTSQRGGRPLTPLLACCLAMFDNTQLLLYLDVKEAKQALVSRDYGKFCVTMPAWDLHLDSEGSVCSLSSRRQDWQLTYDIFFDSDKRMAFRHLALYSVSALELTFKISPKLRSNKAGVSLTPHTATATFHCIQLLASWLCFFANCLNQELYNTWLNGSDSGEIEDFDLLQKILDFAERRKTQYNMDYSVPSSTEMLNERSTGNLAADLLNLFSTVFRSCDSWPSFKHLASALESRSMRIKGWLDVD